MIADVDLDRMIGGWLADGPERAPEARVLAALEQVGEVRQRRRIAGWRVALRGPRSRAVLLAAAVVLVAVAGLGLAIVAGWISPPDTVPRPTAIPAPTDPTASGPPPSYELVPTSIADWSARVSLPSGWAEVPGERIDLRHFGGESPQGHLSIGHESPYWTGVCIPGCRTFELPMTIPYSATTLLDALKAEVAGIAGTSDWQALPSDMLPELTGGVHVESSSVVAGQPWRHVFVVGLRDRNVAAIAWSQPADQFDAALWEAVLAGLTLPSAPVYTDGDLTEHRESGSGFGLRLPGFWLTADQPSVDGSPLSGVWRFAEGRVVVSLGDQDGTIGLCDPGCRRLRGQTSLDILVGSAGQDGALGPPEVTTLGGEQARIFRADAPAAFAYVLAMHEGRPVAVRIDIGDWAVAPGIVQQIVEGFTFVDRAAVSAPDQVFALHDGRVEIGLSEQWSWIPGGIGKLVLGRTELVVHRGSDDGSVTPCATPAGPWESCRPVRPSSLEELVAAVKPLPIADHGVGPPSPRVTTATLDGEPAAIIRIPAYEYPARGGQEVVYIVAFHDGRPYVIRMWTSTSSVAGLDEVIAGFRFVDPAP